MDEAQFMRAWALSQIAPGINLLKLTVLFGFQLRGWPGVLAGAAGLMLPSALATSLMVAGFSLVRGQRLVQAAMRGLLPATIGLSLAMGWQMAQPLLARARRDGPLRLGLHLMILVAGGLLLAVANVSPVLILLLTGLAAVIGFALVPAKSHA